MSHPYTPVEADVISGSIRVEREQQYDPKQLRKLGGGLIGLAKYIEKFADTSCYQTDLISSKRARMDIHDIKIGRPMGHKKEDYYYTAAEVSHLTFSPPVKVADRYIVRLWQWDDKDPEEDQVETEYILDRHRTGKTTLRIFTSMDGLAEALRLEDPSFMRAVKWRDATEYEARQLYEELETLAGATEIVSDTGRDGMMVIK